MNRISRLVFQVLLLSCFLSACKRDDIVVPNTPVDLTSTVNSSVSGFVTNENNQPVQGAVANFGTASATTDAQGYFEFNNITVPKNAAVVSVKIAGYFKGIRTFIAQQEKKAFVRIKLLPKTVAGNIDASTGGTLTMPNGLQIILPASAVVNAASGTAYSGNIRVHAQWINPTASDLNEIMPGDLRGVDTEDNFKSLITYGMAAVELTGAAGEHLQIAPGKTAKLKVAIPSTIAGSAPASIPLWYFDENIGLWKEEGSASKTGNSYEGEVSHFSFWNYDVPRNFVIFNATLLDQSGAVIPFAFVKIHESGNPANQGFGSTNAQGYVTGAIPNNSQLVMEIFADNQCSTLLYSHTFSTGNSDISFGNIVLNSNNLLATITGSINNCSNAPVSNGVIFLQKGNNYTAFPVNSNGTFTFNTPLCNPNTPATLVGQDIATNQQSNPVNLNLVAGMNSAGALQTCSSPSTQFVSYIINGISHHFREPADGFFHGDITNYIVKAQRINSIPGQDQYIVFLFNPVNMAVGTVQEFWSVSTSAIPGGSVANAVSAGVNITEYGPVNGYFAGNFSAVLTGYPPITQSITSAAVSVFEEVIDIN